MERKRWIEFCCTFLLLSLIEIEGKSTGSVSAVNKVQIDPGAAAAEKKRGADDKAATIQEYLEGCGAGYKLQELLSVTFTSPFYGSDQKHPSSLECAWTFVGDKTCTPEIVCHEFNLAQTEECDAESLEISDGVGGVEKLCGKDKFAKPVRASQNQRDLYVKFKATVEGDGHTGFKCEARCSGGNANVLKSGDTGKKEEFRCVCGLQNKDDRIVGGENAKMNEFPWQVAIVTSGTRSPICGGSIINSRYVLTAAHCFYFAKTKPVDIDVLFHARLLDMTILAHHNESVKLGESGSVQASGWNETRLTDIEEKTQRFKVVDIIGHPLFTDSYDYDVALLKLDRKIDLTHPDAPTPLCLPPVGTSDLYEKEMPMVVGWGLGHESAGATTRALQKLAVPVLNLETCQSWTENVLTPRMLCAGYEDGVKDACTGDSGGPLSLKQPNNQWVQIGIVSWGEGCAQYHKPGMYARVTELQQFVEYHSVGATWCRTTKG